MKKKKECAISSSLATHFLLLTSRFSLLLVRVIVNALAFFSYFRHYTHLPIFVWPKDQHYNLRT